MKATWLDRYGCECCGVAAGAGLVVVVLCIFFEPRIAWVYDARALIPAPTPAVKHGSGAHPLPEPPPGVAWSYGLGTFRDRSAWYVARWNVSTSVAGVGECCLWFWARSVGSPGRSEVEVSNRQFHFRPAAPAAIRTLTEAKALATEVGVPVAADMKESDGGPGGWLWQRRDEHGGAMLRIQTDGTAESLTPGWR
jgi:hypothetical protein